MSHEPLNWTQIVVTTIPVLGMVVVALVKGPHMWAAVNATGKAIWEAWKDWRREVRKHRHDLISVLNARIEELEARLAAIEGELKNKSREKHDAQSLAQALQFQLDERERDLAECRERLRRSGAGA